MIGFKAAPLSDNGPRRAARRLAPRVGGALLLAILWIGSARIAPAATADSTPVPTLPAWSEAHARASLLGHRDLWFAAATAGAVWLTARNDRWLTEETTESHSRGQNHLAAAAQPFGNPGAIVPALALAYGVARWTDRAGAARAILNIGSSVGVAGAATLVFKEAVGRERPSEAPNDPDDFHPFSTHHSFPSGHAAIAFAAATAIDQETSARWAPFVVYPTAALVGWSRVHQERHWTSDVAAGAALGIWTALKTERYLHDRTSRSARVQLELAPAAGGFQAAAALRF